MRDEFVRQAHPSLIVEIEELGAAEDRLGLGILFRAEERVVLAQALLELGKQCIAKGFERGRVEGRDAVDAIEILLRENLAKGCRDADAAFSV